MPSGIISRVIVQATKLINKKVLSQAANLNQPDDV